MNGDRVTRTGLAITAGGLLVAAAPLLAQMATADRVRLDGWWPTKPAGTVEDYVGPRECVRCHESRASQLTTAMARTAQRAVDSPVLQSGAPLEFSAGRYAFAIARDGDRRLYSATDGQETASVHLSWALGAGTVGQTYLFERNGSLQEARASFYASVNRLDFTPNRRLDSPRSLEEAMARPVGRAEARRCFACHTTASSTSSGFDLARALPGVTCEACHGPGRRHVHAMERKAPAADRAIMNPAQLDAADSVDFCGACHATFWDVKLANERGLAALRSQPHRLQSSRCWQEGDDRLTCVACHDPHKKLVRDASTYDANCLSCHPASGAAPTASRQRSAGRACPTATTNCTSCHMPKYDVPEMHYAFTDHLIRIVRPSDAASRTP
ncbi:MAG TPA: multiheme c-type cytochrome [Vicinamibacterales bacterium]|nr:multiheme c-type cytochrome [Vicinamibacterales bacterium]